MVCCLSFSENHKSAGLMPALVLSLLSSMRGNWPSAPSHTQQLPCSASTHESTASSPPPVQERSDQLLSCHAILLGQPGEGSKRGFGKTLKHDSLLPARLLPG